MKDFFIGWFYILKEIFITAGASALVLVVILLIYVLLEKL